MVIVSIVIFAGLIWLVDGSQTPTTVDLGYLIGSDPHTKGPEDAALTIVEFSDFQCPACKAAGPVLDAFLQDNPEDVRLIYRHFPLVSIHLNSRAAAVASEVAAESGKFWEYHDLLFANQATWSQESDPTDLFVSYAAQLDIDSETFREKLSQTAYNTAVRDDQVIAQDLNLNSTPTLFINGELYSGVPSTSDLYQYLSEAKSN